ncbi:hypothetical protein I4U23_007977 [Adineta vaga]|nr:hypothetical protein I4U23_007977 [Adineta vaga]
MEYRYLFGGSLLFTCCFLLYYYQSHLLFNINRTYIRSSPIPAIRNHTAIILARQPTSKVLKHLDALVKIGINAFVMCDEQPSKYTNITNRILYVDDETLARYRLTRNRVWDRVFLWLYNQTWIDYVWLMEDDLTWTHARHMLALFNKYEHNTADLLSRNIIYRNNETLDWMWWPKIVLKILPEKKWSGSLNMLSRISHRLINAHKYYIEQLYNERQYIIESQFDDNYYYQEFLIPTVAHMFNLTMLMYDSSNMNVFFTSLSEDDIRQSLKDGKKIFHAVKHNSSLLINT